MVPTVMTVEFGTLHIILIWNKILKLVRAFFEQMQKITEHYVNYDILV